MSRINKIRFVNLNYNNNSMKIDDEKFFLDSESTMLHLRNGGGKTVLVQMIMAPFVNKRYRNFKDRPFESYFTSNTPTYILIEWKLDDAGGYVLTGMMVRKKKSDSDEDSKEKLDIINFISEYSMKNETDIDSLKIVDDNEGKKTVRSYMNSKKLFEDLKKNPQYKFNYYDMNNSATTKAYFDKLDTYKINHKEWENVIKKINLKESGLSDLFSNAKNVEGLVKEWFLPIIENKLNKDEDIIKNYREILSEHIKQYKENKHKIDKKVKVELFNSKSNELYNECNKYIDTIENREETENKIANLISYLKKCLLEKEANGDDLKNELCSLKNDLNDLRYEEKSFEIYIEEDKKKKLEKELYENTEQLNAAEENRNLLKRKRNILFCARIYKEYKEKSEELQAYENNLKILKNKNGDFTPRINDLGYTIKHLLELERKKIKEEQDKNIELEHLLTSTKEKIELDMDGFQNGIKDMSKEIGSLQAGITYFDDREYEFNKKYDESILRNIEGYFNEDDILNLEKRIKDEEKHIFKCKKDYSERLYDLKDYLNSKISEKDDLYKREADITAALTYKNYNLKKYDDDIEERREIIKYVDLDDDSIFSSNRIRELFCRKIGLIKEEENNIRILYEKKKDELIKLEGGKVLELPKDIENEFRHRDIKVVYGMDWLKNNNYSEEKNKEIIKNNPFIPYSIVMDKVDIEAIEKNPINIYTSSPICIVKRENLEKAVVENDGKLISMNYINFFIAFNNKLLNEEELLKIIKEKKKEIKKISDDISSKEEAITFYESKKAVIEKSELTLQRYNELKDDIKTSNDELKNTRDELVKSEKEIQSINDDVDTINKELKIVDRKIDENKRKYDDYEFLKKSYNSYIESKKKFEEVEEIIVSFEKNITDLKKKRIENEKLIEENNEKITFCKDNIKSINDDMTLYSVYNEGTIIEKDSEDLIAEYKALTKKVSDSENDLIQKIKLCNKKFKEIETELLEKVEKYDLNDKEYTSISYHVYKENEIETFLNDEDEKINSLMKSNSTISGDLRYTEKTLSRYYDEIKLSFNKTIPKDKSLIFNKNYKKEEALINIKIKENEDVLSKVFNDISSIKSSLNTLNEYDNLELKSEIKMSVDIKDIDSVVGKIKRDIRELKVSESKNENSLQRALFTVQTNDEFKDEAFFKEPLEILAMLVSKPRDFKEHLMMINDSYEKIIEKLNYDIELIEKEENNIIESMLEYIESIDENISNIDNNSTINIKGKRIKMLSIVVPDWKNNVDVYRIRLKEYIEQLRNQAVKTLNRNESIEEIIGNRINTIKLYDEVISISSINIKIYKIEEDKQRQISWNEVSANSGGEGFLSAFIILSSLLSYMRKDDSDIFSRKEEGKVLIMDNPFAQTNAPHLLKPLMDIAKKSNTQLICLTGLGGDSIYNIFDNIYVLRLVSSKMRSGMKYLKSEHSKGDEEKLSGYEIMESSRFKIENQDQIRLF